MFQSPSHRGPRARHYLPIVDPTYGNQFQSPSHRGPRARRNPLNSYMANCIGFSPLLIGGRARGVKTIPVPLFNTSGFSPLLIGGRARGPGNRATEAVNMAGFSPLLIGGRARGQK